MKLTPIVGSLLLAAVLTLPTWSAAAGPGASETPKRVFDDAGLLIYEQGSDPRDPQLLRTVHYTHLAPAHGNAKPGSGGPPPGTDCASTAYKLAGWHWTTPFSTYATSHATEAAAALGAWDAATGGAISGTVLTGSQGTAGQLDGVNQIDWVDLGASTTIAVTTTWSYRGSGEAVESDGQYNTHYAWATDGDPNRMDALDILTHETGHTFGLTHPRGAGASCLTMYAYANYGETQKRTLGDGDILGIRAIYGN